MNVHCNLRLTIEHAVILQEFLVSLQTGSDLNHSLRLQTGITLVRLSS